MSISFKCNECGKAYRFGDEKAGKRFKCRKCGAAVQIPAADDDWDEEFEEPEPPARRSSSSRAANRKQSKSGKGKKKKSSSSSSSLPLILGGGGGLIAVIGLVVGGIFLFGGDDDPAPENPDPGNNVVANGDSDAGSPDSQPPTNGGTNSSNRKPPTESGSLSITAMELTQAFKNDPDAAAKLYKDKTLLISGEIRQLMDGQITLRGVDGKGVLAVLKLGTITTLKYRHTQPIVINAKLQGNAREGVAVAIREIVEAKPYAPPADPPEGYAAFTPKEILDELKKDAKAFSNRFKYHREKLQTLLVIEGLVSKAARDELSDRDHPTFNVVLSEPDANIQVKCILNEEFQKTVEAMNTGEKVRFVGQYSSSNLSDLKNYRSSLTLIGCVPYGTPSAPTKTTELTTTAAPKLSGPLQSLKGIGKLAVSRDGSLLATLTGFGTSVFEVWNLSDGTAKRKIELPNPVQGMAISSDYRFLAATHGKSDGPKTFSVWNLETGEAVAEHEVVQAGESRFSGDVQFSSDGKQAVCSAVVALASIDVDSGELRLLEVSKAATFEGAYFGNIACSPTDGNIALAVVGGNGSSIQIRDLGSFEESVSIKPRVTAMKLGFSLDGKTFVAVCASGEIRAWNASTGEATAAIKDRTARIVLTQLFSVSPDGRFAVSRALNPSDLYIWDLGEETRLELGPDMAKIRFRDFTFMPGGRLAGAAFGQSIQFFDVTKLKPATSAK